MDDHDLLIRVDTKVDGLTHEIKNMRDDSIRRLNVVEREKLNTSDFSSFKEYIEVKDKDIETRIRSVERFVWIAIGIMTVVDLIGIPLILKYIL